MKIRPTETVWCHIDTEGYENVTLILSPGFVYELTDINAVYLIEQGKAVGVDYVSVPATHDLRRMA